MKSKLARVFIEKSIIQKGSIIEAYHSVKGISGQYDAAVLSSFRLTGAKAVGEWVYFDAIDDDKQECRIRCDYVMSLDGMPVGRIAESHHLTEDGDERISNARRGRRKKQFEILDKSD